MSDHTNLVSPLFLELGVTEHIEGDETKFAVWTGRAPMVADYRVVLKAHNLETKQMWVKKLREVIQETYFAGTFPKSPAKNSNINSVNMNNNNGKNPSQRSSRDLDEVLAENDNDVSSLASFGSGNTTDSDKVSKQRYWECLHGGASWFIGNGQADGEYRRVFMYTYVGGGKYSLLVECWTVYGKAAVAGYVYVVIELNKLARRSIPGQLELMMMMTINLVAKFGYAIPWEY